MNLRTLRAFFQNLYVRISAIIFALVLLTSAAQVTIVSRAVTTLGAQAEQQVYWGSASAIAEHIQASASPEFNPEQVLRRLFDFSRLNPNLAFFLLDASGRIVLHYPEGMLLNRTTVPIEPLEALLTPTPPELPVFGPNPATPQSPDTLFSVARLEIGDQAGYVYVTFQGLASRSLRTRGQFIVTRVGLVASLIVGIGTIALGSFLFYLITRRLRSLNRLLKEFSNGDFTNRFPASRSDEVDDIGRAVNMLADSVVEAQLALKQRDETRRALVADVSHDLRSPVLAIQLRTDLIAEAVEESNITSVGTQIPPLQRSVDALQRLVADLFELTKLEAKGSLVVGSVRVLDLLEAVREQTAPSAERSNVSLVLEMLTAPEVTCEVDQQLITRMLANLVENAIRHSPAQSTIIVRARPTSDGKRLQLEVQDQGSGVAEELISSLFQRGTHATGSTGAGLGLAISRTIAELHHGSLSYAPAEGGGSIFRAEISTAFLRQSD